MKPQSSIIKLEVLEERVCTMRKQNDIDHAEILKKIEEINIKLDRSFVPLSRYAPVEKIVYGMVTVILIAVIGAIIRLVVK
jgi:hypothetical protein